MKNLNIYFLLAVFLTGCASDPATEKKIPLMLSATYSGVSAKSAFTLPSDLSTGIYVTPKDSALTSSCFSNHEYTSDNSGSLSSAQNIYLLVGYNYDIYAYAPFLTNVSDPRAVVFNHGTDVLWAPKYTLMNVTATNNSAALNFTHRAAQISFNVVFADDFTSGSKVFTSSSTIQVNGFYSQGILNVTTGELTPSGSTSASLSANGSGSVASSSLDIDASCFFPAQGTMSLKVKVVHEGLEYNGSITDSFFSENAYNYTITINNHSPVLGIRGTLTDWIPVSDSISLEQ